MRLVLLGLLALTGCAATVRNLESGPVAGRGTDGDAPALVAGELLFGESRIVSTMRWRRDDGRVFEVRPGPGAFLVAVPPGRYEIRRFGAYDVCDDTITFAVSAGAARYIGSFQAARDRDGDLRVAVRDRRAAARDALRESYPDIALERSLVRSALVPADRTASGDDLVIAVRRPAPPTYRYGIGFGFHSHFGRRHFHRRSARVRSARPGSFHAR